MLSDRVEQTSTTTGTGTYSLTGTVANRRTFVTGIGTGKQCYYLAVDNTNGGYEIGIGTVTDLATDTLSRDTILRSSNGDLAVNWPAGTRNIMVVAPAELFGVMGGRLLKGTVGGTANAITVTTPIPLRTLTDGALVLFDPTADTNGAVMLNVDGTGLISLRDSVGAAFDATKILKSGQTVLGEYKSSTGFWHVLSALEPIAAAGDTVAGRIEIAVQAEMEAATDALRAVTAARQHFHPGHAKAWLKAALDSGTPTLNRDHGVSSLSDDGVGLTTATVDTAFSAADYGVTGMSGRSTGSVNNTVEHDLNGTYTTTAFQVRVYATDGSARDTPYLALDFYGDL